MWFVKARVRHGFGLEKDSGGTVRGAVWGEKGQKQSGYKISQKSKKKFSLLKALYLHCDFLTIALLSRLLNV